VESVRLSSGTIEYEDSGGDGPVIVLVGGLLMDATLWRDVVPRLAPTHRCVVPVLPLGGHRRAMDADADLSLHGLAALLAEFIERLDLHRVTLVANDWGGPQITAVQHPERLAALVLLPEEAFDNIPPGLPGKVAGLAGRVPGGIFPVAQTLRIPFMRRLPFTFGWMAKRPIPPDVMASWIRGVCTDRRVRRDVAKYVRTSDYEGLQAAAAGLASFDRPTLVLWARDDRVMPREHGERLSGIIPGARLVEIDDSYTLMPLDRPDAVADHLAAFVAEAQGRRPQPQ
jgi:pimeloyl-ACP methyl ester carboxylesterase